MNENLKGNVFRDQTNLNGSVNLDAPLIGERSTPASGQESDALSVLSHGPIFHCSVLPKIQIDVHFMFYFCPGYQKPVNSRCAAAVATARSATRAAAAAALAAATRAAAAAAVAASKWLPLQLSQQQQT